MRILLLFRRGKACKFKAEFRRAIGKVVAVGAKADYWLAFLGAWPRCAARCLPVDTQHHAAQRPGEYRIDNSIITLTLRGGDALNSFKGFILQQF